MAGATAGRVQTKGSTLGDSALLVLGGIDALTKKHGYPPTYREIGEFVHLQYTSVQHHVGVLASLGLVTRERYGPRTLVVTATGKRYLA